jgi:hypothetical protein
LPYRGVVALTVTITVAEGIGGRIYMSMALVADDLSTHVGALMIAAVAYRFCASAPASGHWSWTPLSHEFKWDDGTKPNRLHFDVSNVFDSISEIRRFGSCDQVRLVCSAGVRLARAKVRSPVVRMAG